MNPREVALTCLIKLSTEDMSISSVVDDAFNRYTINIRDRRFINALVYGVTRWKQQLDWVLGQFVNPQFRLDSKHRAILRLGTFQLLHLDGIPPHAAINETVQLAKKNRKTVGFINAVLRSVQRNETDLVYPSLDTHPIDHIVYSMSYPKWLVKRWIQSHGLPWTLAFCEASNKIAPLTLRVNTLNTNRDKLCETLKSYGLDPRVSTIAPDAIVIDNNTFTPSSDKANQFQGKTLSDVINHHDVYIQDESAMLVSYLLMKDSPKLIVDLCAAPGGKTTHIASMIGDTGSVIATDISEKKLTVLRENCKRLSVQNIETQIIDATNPNLRFIKSTDAVLIDAPCSGFGTLRRHPDIRWNKTAKQLQSLNDLQYILLVNAARHIKQGGILVYSTCSIEQTENEKIVHRFLSKYPMFIVEHAQECLPNIPQSAITPQGFLQTLPHEHGVDGTFAARLRRI